MLSWPGLWLLLSTVMKCNYCKWKQCCNCVNYTLTEHAFSLYNTVQHQLRKLVYTLDHSRVDGSDMSQRRGHKPSKRWLMATCWYVPPTHGDWWTKLDPLSEQGWGWGGIENILSGWWLFQGGDMACRSHCSSIKRDSGMPVMSPMWPADIREQTLLLTSWPASGSLH